MGDKSRICEREIDGKCDTDGKSPSDLEKRAETIGGWVQKEDGSRGDTGIDWSASSDDDLE